jgi:hypothetical protein
MKNQEVKNPVPASLQISRYIHAEEVGALYPVDNPSSANV